MKKLYEYQKHSLYELQKMLNLDIKRLYRYADGTITIDKMPTDLLFKIAKAEAVDPYVLFGMMKEYQKKLNK